MKLLFLASLLSLPFLLAGCDVIPPPQADATRFYVLSGPGVAAAPAERPGVATRGLRIGIRNVELAGYLRTRSIVMRNGTNELVLEDFQRWAEPLDEGIGRLVRARVLADPAVGRMLPQPFPFDVERDYDVAITVLRCEGGTRGSTHAVARFSAVIDISTAGVNPLVVAHRVFTAEEAPWDGRDFGELARLLGEDATALGDEVVSLLPAAPAP